MKSSRSAFTAIYENNAWSGVRSISGPGSEMDQTRVLRAMLPELIGKEKVRTMLDAPCGDLHWIKEVDLGVEEYIGGDIVPRLIEENRNRFGGEKGRSFQILDISKDPLPKVDLIFCRDCLVHLPLKEALAALRNFKRSGSRLLLTTTFPARNGNPDVQKGLWRPLNLMRPPFNLPEPRSIILEECTEQGGLFSDKSLGLWELDSLDLEGPR